MLTYLASETTTVSCSNHMPNLVFNRNFCVNSRYYLRTSNTLKQKKNAKTNNHNANLKIRSCKHRVGRPPKNVRNTKAKTRQSLLVMLIKTRSPWRGPGVSFTAWFTQFSCLHGFMSLHTVCTNQGPRVFMLTL
jgi:hypothetical protein